MCLDFSCVHDCDSFLKGEKCVVEKAVGGDGPQDIGKGRINERILGEVGGVNEMEGQGGGGRA